MTNDGTWMTFADGERVLLDGFRGSLDQIKVPFGGTRKRSHGLADGATALVTSILVMPPGTGLVPPDPDLGTLIFFVDGLAVFDAPVSSLMNRYHGLSSLAGLANVLPEPIRIRPHRAYELRHVVSAPAPEPDDALLVASDLLRERGLRIDPAVLATLVRPPRLTVEMQAMLQVDKGYARDNAGDIRLPWDWLP